MTKAEKNTKAVRRQRHKTKSYFSLPLFGSDPMRDCITFAISAAVRSCVWSQDVAFAPLKLFPIHSPHPPTPSPTTGALSRLLPLSQTNKRSFQRDGGGEMHPFVKSSCILSRLPFPQGSVCPLSKRGSQQVCKLDAAYLKRSFCSDSSRIPFIL